MAVIEVQGKRYDIDGILFDKDGTLLNFDKLWSYWVKVFIGQIIENLGDRCDLNPLQCAKSLGYDWLTDTFDKKGPMLTGNLHDIVSILSFEIYKQSVPWNEAVRIVQRSYEIIEENTDWSGCIKPLPGLMQFLRKANSLSLKMAVVTADETASAVKHLEYLKIRDFFQEVIGDDQVLKGKPNPDMALLACERLKGKPGRFIVIGDSNGDMQMAKSAGILAAIGVDLGRDPEHLKDADHIITDFNEITILSSKAQKNAS